MTSTADATLPAGGGTDSDAAASVAKATPAPVVPPKDPQGPIRPQDRDRRVTATDLTIGGGRLAAAGNQVSLHYTMKLTNGRVVEDTHAGGAPKQLELGKGGIMAAIEEGVVGMRPGGTRRLLIPSILAYGPGGLGTQVPPDSDLEVEVELLTVTD